MAPLMRLKAKRYWLGNHFVNKSRTRQMAVYAANSSWSNGWPLVWRHALKSALMAETHYIKGTFLLVYAQCPPTLLMPIFLAVVGNVETSIGACGNLFFQFRGKRSTVFKIWQVFRVLWVGGKRCAYHAGKSLKALDNRWSLSRRYRTG